MIDMKHISLTNLASPTILGVYLRIRKPSARVQAREVVCQIKEGPLVFFTHGIADSLEPLI